MTPLWAVQKELCEERELQFQGVLSLIDMHRKVAEFVRLSELGEDRQVQRKISQRSPVSQDLFTGKGAALQRLVV